MEFSRSEPTRSAGLAAWLTDLLQGLGSLVGSSCVELFSGRLDQPVKRGLWLLVVLPLILLKLLVDGVCLLLDEVFFPRAKETPIEQPVFVV